MSSCRLWPEDFVHITGYVVSCQGKGKTLESDRSRLGNTSHLALSLPHPIPSRPSPGHAYSLSSEIVSIYCLHQHSLHLRHLCTLNWLVLYHWFDHIIRNKCEQVLVIVCKLKLFYLFNFCQHLPFFNTSASQSEMCFSECECVYSFAKRVHGIFKKCLIAS